MCRWAAYRGPEIHLEELVSRPGHALVRQAREARLGATGTNADGFGLAWYGARPEPGLYRDVLPAWADENLLSLARTVRSRLFLAHVRAATGTATSRNNCHPFAVGRWCFCHNGQIGGFERLRRRAELLISEAFYAHRRGTTDSEAFFLLALTEGLDRDPKGALERAAGKIEALARAAGAAPLLRLTAALSDGRRLHAVRYASDGQAPSLFHRLCPLRGGRAVVSEPLDEDVSGWFEVPQATFVTFDAGDAIRMEPFRPAAAAAPAAAA